RSSEHVAGNSSNSAGSGHWDGALGRLHGRHGRARLRFLYRTGTGWRAGGFVETHEQGCRSDFRERRRVGKELRGTAAQSSILIGERYPEISSATGRQLRARLTSIASRYVVAEAN